MKERVNRILPRKTTAKRLFSGMAGSPLARVGEPVPQAPPASEEVRTTQQIVDETMARVAKAHDKFEVKNAAMLGLAENRRRGRPAKYATEGERLAADAARKRADRREETEKASFEKLANRTGVDAQGAIPGETNGGYGSQKVDEIVAQQNTDRLSSSETDTENLSTPDRKVTLVPKNPDNETKDTRETDNTFQRRAAAALSRWAKAGGPPKKKSCVTRHQEIADKNLNSRTKVYCVCGKLVVSPGKAVKGIKRTEPVAA